MIRTVWEKLGEGERRKGKTDEQQITMPEETRQLYDAK